MNKLLNISTLRQRVLILRQIKERIVSALQRVKEPSLTRWRGSKRKLHFAEAVSSAYVGTVEGASAKNREKPCSARLPLFISC